MTDDIKFYEVGGAVRDKLMGLVAKDIDFVAIAPSFAALEARLKADGFKIFLAKEEFATIRASIPTGHPLRARTKDADFVLSRKDGPSSDGRRPDYVEPGTLEDDLRRRDFTINAIAIDPLTDQVIDLFEGQEDIKSGTLRFVGDPMTRIREDGLRVLRGFRFMVTKGLQASDGTWAALISPEAAQMLACVSIERVREEIEKMALADTIGMLRVLRELPSYTLGAIFRSGLRLTATLKS